jgi:hypothetical protein
MARYRHYLCLFMYAVWKNRHIGQVFRYSARRSILGHVQVVQLARRFTLAVSPFCGLSLTIHLSHVFANPRRHGCQGDSRVLHGMRSFGTWVFADALEADP